MYAVQKSRDPVYSGPQNLVGVNSRLSMLCPRCKSEQPETSKFCSQCAAPLARSSAASSRLGSIVVALLLAGGTYLFLKAHQPAPTMGIRAQTIRLQSQVFRPTQYTRTIARRVNLGGHLVFLVSVCRSAECDQRFD